MKSIEAGSDFSFLSRPIAFPHPLRELEGNKLKIRNELEGVWKKGEKTFREYAQTPGYGMTILGAFDWNSSHITTTLDAVGEQVGTPQTNRLGKIRSALDVGKVYKQEKLDTVWTFTRQELLQLLAGAIAYKVSQQEFYRKRMLQDSQSA